MIKQKLILDVEPFETRVALLEDNTLVEYHGIPADTASPDRFYRGRIRNIEPSLDAAFVDIDSSGQPGFLSHVGKRYREGDICLVQVEANPGSSIKGLRLRDRPLLTGRYMILKPGQSGVHVSLKLSETQQRQARDYATAICPQGFGLIVRTSWRELQPDQLDFFNRELDQLMRYWETVRKNYQQSLEIGPVSENTEALDLCRLLLPDPDAEIYVNQAELLSVLRSEQALLPAGGAVIHDETARGPLIFDPFRIDPQLERASHRKLWLRSGGFLIVDYAEAFTVYDVNSGKDNRRMPPEEKALEVNLEAVEMVLRHLRLCNIGGIILVDLIDMKKPENFETLLRTVRKLSLADHGAVHESGITSLGILQLTRRRTGLPLHRTYMAACERCHEHGLVEAEITVEGNIRREIARKIASGQQSGYRIHCTRSVKDLILQDPFFDGLSISFSNRQNYMIESVSLNDQ